MESIIDDEIKCIHCGASNEAANTLLSVSALSNELLYLFCMDCGLPYSVTEEDGQFRMGYF